MYPIYFEQQAPCYYRQRRPHSMMDNYLSAFINEQQQQAVLQAAYRQEQERRRRLQQQQEEEERKRRILLQRRRQELQEQQLRAYYAAIQREQEARKRRQQQEEERQAYYAALRQQREKDQQQQGQEAEYLLNLLFGIPPANGAGFRKQQQDVQQPLQRKATEQTETSEKSRDDKDAMTMNDFVDYIHEKARQLDDEQVNEEAEQQQKHAEEDYIQEPIDIAEMAMEHLDDNENDNNTEEQQVLNDVTMEEENTAVANKDEDGQEEFTNFPEEDPAKLAKYEALSQIEAELNDIRQKHEDHILHTTLDFSNVNGYTCSSSPDTLSASTAGNREFLGYEDQIMKVLMKLDAIDSEGDENIRNERKALVKQAENMLGKLDEFKQKEWERVSLSSHSDLDEEEDMNQA